MAEALSDGMVVEGGGLPCFGQVSIVEVQRRDEIYVKVEVAFNRSGVSLSELLGEARSDIPTGDE